MQAQSSLNLQLAAGESRQILVDAGSELFVFDGSLLLRQPPLWLAERLLVRECVVAAETLFRLDAGGWIELSARERCSAVVVGPGGSGWWPALKARLGWPVAPREGYA
jgi:hypothetical protein